MKQQPGPVLVSNNATTQLGELLWIGTNTQFNHPSDGVFKSIGSYYLWLKTKSNPSVRFFSWDVGQRMLSTEAGFNLNVCEPDHHNRIVSVICMLLQSYGMLQTFTNPATTLTFENVPMWYAQLVQGLQNRLISG